MTIDGAHERPHRRIVTIADYIRPADRHVHDHVEDFRRFIAKDPEVAQDALELIAFLSYLSTEPSVKRMDHNIARHADELSRDASCPGLMFKIAKESS